MRQLSDDVLYLRPVEPEDLELLYREENDSSIWWLGEQTGPYSRFLLRQYLADVTGDIYTDRQLRLVAVRCADDMPVGLVDLSNFSPQHLRAEVGVLVFPQFRNQGHALRMLKLLEDFAREHGITFYEGEGVCHQVMMEKHVRPGELIFGADYTDLTRI